MAPAMKEPKITPTSKSRNPFKHLRTSDIRGIAQLATQATEGVTRIVEGVHQSVWSTLGVTGGKSPGQTGGITGLVYTSIRGINQLLGEGVGTALAGLESLLERGEGAEPGTPQRERVLAALNGVMGDRLATGNSPFATPMTMWHRGEMLAWPDPLSLSEATAKVVVLIHGLCMNDLQWHTRHDGQVVDHGEALASALGYTPIYLRYNSGLHTSHNGRELSAQLEQLVTNWPTPIDDLTVVAHSMGGLLARSAFHSAEQEDLCWPDHLKNMVFLGTPHHGAPLEKAGNWIDIILGSTPFTAPFTRLGQLRSSGITDLRYGNLLDEDWHGHDRFHHTPDNRQIVPLPEGVACFTVAATTAAKSSPLADRLTGDGLVPVRSALGQHDDPRRALAFARASQRTEHSTNHLGLLSSPEVTRQLVRWLEPAKDGSFLHDQDEF